MHIDESLRFFANHLQPRAIVISGRWGVGKTFYWREQVVKGYFANANLRREDRGYAYVSLFGIDSIKQLKNGLAYSYAENRQPGLLRAAWHWVRRSSRKVLGWISHGFTDELSLSTDNLGVTVKLTTLVDDFAFLSIKRSLICIDDLERRNKNLSIGDVLGLVSYLVDQRNCRVAVILNFDTLSAEEQAEWERAKDKTFEAELLYKPSMEDSIRVGMAGTEHEAWHEQVKACLVQLKIDNVRVIARTQRFVRQTLQEMKRSPQLEGLTAQAWDEIVKVACLCAATNASRSVGAPSLDELLSTSMISLSGENEEAISSEARDWRERIRGYGLYLGDNLDSAIAQSVQDGYPRMDLLVPAALDWHKERSKGERKQKFHDAWRLYHDSLNTDSDALFNAFNEVVAGVVAIESIGNISSTGVLFRELGHQDAATKLFQSWIDARMDGRHKELDEEGFYPGNKIDDQFLEMIRESRKSLPLTTKPLEDALVEIDSGSWGEDSILAVSQANPKEIVAVLISIQRSWHRCVQILSTYSSPEKSGEQARIVFMEALREIAKMSKLNETRIKGKLGGVELSPPLVADVTNPAEVVLED